MCNLNSTGGIALIIAHISLQRNIKKETSRYITCIIKHKGNIEVFRAAKRWGLLGEGFICKYKSDIRLMAENYTPHK